MFSNITTYFKANAVPKIHRLPSKFISLLAGLIMTLLHLIARNLQNLQLVNLLGGKRIGLALVGVLFISTTDATTYYSVADGNWTAPIWSSGCSTCTPGITLP